MSGDDSREVGELLCRQGQELIAGLTCLQRAGRTLARGDERRHLGVIGIDVADDGRLGSHGILEASHRILPARLRVRDQRLIRKVG